MADTFSIKVEGLQELEKKMIALGPKIGRKALKGALVAGAVVIREEAKRLAPALSGRLRKAMYVKTMGKPNPYKENVIFGVRHGRKMSKKDLDAYYWSWLEFGTKFIKKMSFVEIAFKNKVNEALERIKVVLTKKIILLAKEKV